MTKGLIIFAREPLPGRVKTRLAQDIGDQAAIEIYTAMLEDTLEQANRLDSVQPLLFWSLETSTLPVLNQYPQISMHAQQGKDLGERMAAALAHSFNTGFCPCCIIGTDSPDLPAKHIHEAFELLERDESDVVFGPANDGGYYLVGLRKTWSGLFEGIPWSTSVVLEENLRQAKMLGLRTSLLPSWYDIDTLEDLRRLSGSSINNATRTHQAAQELFYRQPDVK